MKRYDCVGVTAHPTGLYADYSEVSRLEKWIDDLQSGMWINCVYCGHRYGPNASPTTKDFKLTMRKTLEQHINVCPKHPLSIVSGNYNELIMQVSRCSPGESRHETALRYIREAERERIGGKK
jgi:hypothetical protein